MLNDYFCSQAVVNDNNKPLPQHTFTCNSRLNSITISQQDVRDVLNNLNVTKASGPDLISPRLLKEGATILSKPLSIIFNRSLLQGYFPSNWKDANVTAIYKKADKFVCLFCCFTSHVNSYGHCGTVSSPNPTFSWAGLNKRLTSISAHTFACN